MKTFLEKKDATQFLGRLPIALFDIYWLKSNGNKVKIHSVGSFISEKKLNRIMSSPTSFDFDWKSNNSWLIEGIEYFERLKELGKDCPPDLVALDDWRVDFINWATPSLWYGDVTNVTFLDLVVLMCAFLEVKMSDFYEEFDRLSSEVQGRNLIISSTLCFLALTIGHSEENFLHDLFCTFLYIDYLYCEEGWDQHEHDLIQKVSVEGLESLSEDEKIILKQSYLMAMKRAQQQVSESLKYRYISDYLNWGMEDFRGSGIEFKVKMNEMSDLELIMILLLRGVGYEKDILEKPVERTINELIVGSLNLSDRIRRVVSSSVQVASERNTNFLKISGL